jgi:hypothetical protein
MTPAASLATKTSRSVGLLVGALVIAVIVAVIAAKPGHEPAVRPAAGSAVAATHPAVALAARETRFDFGQISMAAGSVSHRYWFRNEWAAPVLIQRIFTSCMCTTATLVKGVRVIGRYGMAGHGPLPDVNYSLEPGEAAYVDVAFDPAAHGPAGLGPTERVVTIEPRTGEPLQFGFTANVRP